MSESVKEEHEFFSLIYKFFQGFQLIFRKKVIDQR